MRGEIELHNQRAQEAMKANELDKATNEFREILRLDPKRAEAHANLGVIAYSQDNYADAIKSFSTALNLNPSLWDAQAFLGLSEIRVGRTQDAKALLQKSFEHIQNRSLSIQAGTELITIDQQSNTLERAVDVVQNLLQSNPNDPTVLYIAYRTYSDLAAHAVATSLKSHLSPPECTRLLRKLRHHKMIYPVRSLNTERYCRQIRRSRASITN